jgi:hypothetical protein
MHIYAATTLAVCSNEQCALSTQGVHKISTSQPKAPKPTGQLRAFSALEQFGVPQDMTSQVG